MQPRSGIRTVGSRASTPNSSRPSTADVMALDPAVAATRTAVRRALTGQPDLAAGDRVAVAVSGGADSLALAAATAWVAPGLGFRVGAVTVDHGLQDGSGDRAVAVA